MSPIIFTMVGSWILGGKHMRPSVFIGSSSEGLDVARAVQQELHSEADVAVWHQGVFGLNQGNLENLVLALDKYDFAILVLTADDLIEVRGQASQAPRDNVLLELGMFLGRLGRQRTFVLFDSDNRPKIPSDLAGVTLATYRVPADKNLRAGVGPACTDFLTRIRSLGNQHRVATNEHPLVQTLLAISTNLERAMKVAYEPFQEEIAFKCNEWRALSSEWARGTVVVRNNYSRLLLEVYRAATSSIFSTSVPEYRSMWQSPVGHQLIEAQRENKKAKSTRVFIFDRRSDVTAEDRSVFQAHADAGIEVRVYFDEEDRVFLFPADLGRDWTVVDDGNVIGVTRSMGEFYEARWYFNDADQIARFLDYRRNLLKVSVPATNL
ncbi:MAG TPA: TIR domain-containing protein [Myxococcaceae bacterium]|jgi:hypothetical protein